MSSMNRMNKKCRSKITCIALSWHTASSIEKSIENFVLDELCRHFLQRELLSRVTAKSQEIAEFYSLERTSKTASEIDLMSLATALCLFEVKGPQTNLLQKFSVHGGRVCWMQMPTRHSDTPSTFGPTTGRGAFTHFPNDLSMAPALSTAAARQKLAALRTGSTEVDLSSALPPHYDPSEVLALGNQLLATTLPDIERFPILEQTCIAALDTGDNATARRLLEIIEASFPFDSSIRTQRLYGLFKEANEDWDKAIQIYETALTQDESNIAVRKRLVAVLAARGRRSEAIEALVTHVDTYTQDTESWSQLANLYLAENMYQQAAFCVEELMLQKPGSHLYHVRYADIQMTLGKPELALKYYCSALDLCTDNLRALYGLRIAASAVARARGDGGGRGKSGKAVAVSGDVNGADPASDEVVEALHKLAGERLATVYEGQGKGGAELASVVKTWLQAS
ncbi:ER membrane complex subunit 2 [Borealophlyctis nickersoniae]|nr:ER membrane complex subunit 2 [Borealophlyctis nickersoniae]